MLGRLMGLGIATINHDQRAQAALGLSEYAKTSLGKETHLKLKF